jgi:hypothetical protein
MNWPARGEDPPAVRRGTVSKADYIDEIGAGIDLVPDPILEIVLDEMLDSGRRIKPSLRELQSACRAKWPPYPPKRTYARRISPFQPPPRHSKVRSNAT